MGVRVRPKARESAANKAPEPRGLWRWLKEKDNRTVLQFVGAGIVALIGVLTTMGILHQPAPPETHPVQRRHCAVRITPAATGQSERDREW